jgi:hypothetical protein
VVGQGVEDDAGGKAAILELEGVEDGLTTRTGWAVALLEDGYSKTRT